MSAVWLKIKARIESDAEYADRRRELQANAHQRYRDRARQNAETAAKIRRQSQVRVHRHYASPANKLAKVKKAATARRIEWALSDERALELFGMPCHYCQRSGCDNGGLVGIDRKDNLQGYTPENSLPCCGMCNHAKNRRSYEAMQEYIRAIAVNRRDLCAE